MASFTLTQNLKLRLNTNLTADSKYNLQRIDLLGGTFLTDSTDSLNIRSRSDINLEPNSADIGGSGVGGSFNIGNPNHLIANLTVYASTVTFSSNVGLLDQAVGGNKYLQLQYLSTLNGSVDTLANRTLSIDMDGADRSLILGGNLCIQGGPITFLTSSASSVTVPLTGTLATLAGIETLTNKSIDANANILTNITNVSISASAAIAYSKLNLLGSVVNTDISTSAGIVYSKLNIANSILNSDINAAAAIARSKLASGTPNQVIINDNSGVLSSVAVLPITSGGTGQSSAQAAINALLPSQTGQAGEFLSTDGTHLLWATPSGGGGGGSSFTALWSSGDGTTKTVVHSLGSNSVQVTLIDLDDSSIIGVDSIIITNMNTVTLSASEAPNTSWRVVIQA